MIFQTWNKQEQVLQQIFVNTDCENYFYLKMFGRSIFIFGGTYLLEEVT